MKHIQIEIGGIKHNLNVTTALEKGCLEPVIPPIRGENINPGDVYVHPTGTCNSFLVIETRYNNLGTRHARKLHLLGMGCRMNSTTFFADASEHTPEEVAAYLNEKGMRYATNIDNLVKDTVRAIVLP